MTVTWTPASGNVYQEVSGTFTFNDNDVSWVYVDWNDGEDNSIENAVYEWASIDTDSKTISLPHTYTKHGTFYPVVRTVNDENFLSKYYYSGGYVNNLPEPNEQVQTITPITISDTNPYGVLKVENKQFLSGIDNTIFQQGPKSVYIQVAPTVASGTSATLTGKSLKLEVTGVEAVKSNTTYADFGYERNLVTVNKTFTLNDRNGTQDAVKISDKVFVEILEVKLITAKITADGASNDLIDAFNGLKIFLTAKANDSNFYPITYITNGDPIKNAKDIKRNVKLDFSQSRGSASNATISYYSYDNGKVFWQPKDQWQASSSTVLTDATETTDSLLGKSYTYYARADGLKGTDFINTVSNSAAFYSGNSWLYDTTGKTNFVRNQFLINEFNQFYNQYHLARMTATTDTNKNNPTQTFKSIYRIQPPAKSTGSTAYFVNQSTGSQDLTTNAYYNTTSYPVSSNKWNAVSYLDSAGNARDATSYLVLGLPDKYGKVFFNNSIYANDFMTSLSTMQGQKVTGVYYLRLSNVKRGDKFTQKAEWVPLEFEDTTKVEKRYRNSSSETYENKSTTLARSGYIGFDTPTDWSKTSIQDLCGGFFNVSGQANSVTNVDNDFSVHLSGTLTFNHLSTTSIDGWDCLALSGTSVETALSGTYTDEDLSGYKYIFQCDKNSSSHNGEVLWVASSSIADRRLFLVSGNIPSTNVTAATNFSSGYLRRINIYDVFDGASKLSDRAAPPNYNNAPSASYAYNFVFGGTDTSFDDLTADTVSGSFQNVYPLKIMLSGTTLDNNTATSTEPNQEIWNILPAASSSSQILIQKDNTAYDLTYLPITSNVSVAFSGTFYQAITKGGKAFIIRTGTPIQNITLSSKAMGDESSFTYSNDYTSFSALEKIRSAQSKAARVFWDEQQKDGTYVRYFGFISGVNETHSNQGKRAPRDFNASLIVEEIVLLNASGELISDVTPLGGVADARNFS